MLVVDDGSRDGTPDILCEIAGCRFSIILGCAGTRSTAPRGSGADASISSPSGSCSPTDHAPRTCSGHWAPSPWCWAASRSSLLIERLGGLTIGDRPLLITAVLLVIAGLQLFVFGLLAELIVYRRQAAPRHPDVSEGAISHR